MSLGGGTVYFPPGTYTCTGAIIVNGSNVTLLGSGRDTASALTYKTGTSRTAAIIVGNTAVVQNSNIDSLYINAGTGANAYQTGSGHGIVFRSNGGYINNTIVQWTQGDNFHLALDSLSATALYDVTMYNNYGQFSNTGIGLNIDTNFNNCEYTNCKFEGYVVNSGGTITGNGGVSGVNCMGGEQKFLNCHCYGWASGGAVVGNGGTPPQGISFIGGEYETNTGAGIYLNGVLNAKIIGVDCYGNSSQDLNIIASYVTIEDCLLTSGNSGAIVLTACTGVIIADNIINNTSFSNGIYLENSSTGCVIHHNYINTGSNTSVTLNDSTYCDVAGNVLSSGIFETSGANFNRWYGNIFTGVPNVLAPSGANSVQYLNAGSGVASTQTVQQSNYAATSPVVLTAASITALG